MFETKIYVANKKGLCICNFDNINKITVFFGKKKQKNYSLMLFLLWIIIVSSYYKWYESKCLTRHTIFQNIPSSPKPKPCFIHDINYVSLFRNALGQIVTEHSFLIIQLWVCD